MLKDVKEMKIKRTLLESGKMIQVRRSLGN